MTQKLFWVKNLASRVEGGDLVHTIHHEFYSTHLVTFHEDFTLFFFLRHFNIFSHKPSLRRVSTYVQYRHPVDALGMAVMLFSSSLFNKHER
jgi:hypothetical protein